MTFSIGDWVEQATKGIGQISEDDGTYYRINFISHGPVKFLKSATLKAGSPPYRGYTFAKVKPTGTGGSKSSSKNKKPPVPFDNLVARFLGLFKDGFEEPFFDEDERKYKEKAATLLGETLGRDEMSALLNLSAFLQICQRARALVNATNLIFKQEKIKLQNALTIDSNQEAFARGLFQLLHSEESDEMRFEAFTRVLGSINALTWTTATYFQFLQTRGQVMFMKPGVMKPMADSVGIELNYKPEPNGLTFSKMQEMVAVVEENLRERGLEPHSRIDVQSFIWTSVKADAGEY